MTFATGRTFESTLVLLFVRDLTVWGLTGDNLPCTATLIPWIFCRLNVAALLDSALLLGRKVKVYWPLEEAWFAGSITDHCSTSLKHKVAALLLFLYESQACASLDKKGSRGKCTPEARLSLSYGWRGPHASLAGSSQRMHPNYVTVLPLILSTEHGTNSYYSHNYSS